MRYVNTCLSINSMQLLFSFDQDVRDEETRIQITLFSTPIQLVSLFDQDIRVEKTHTNYLLLHSH